MVTPLTVYVVAESEPDWPLLTASSQAAGATLIRLPPNRLAQELPAASVLGAVVVVVDGDQGAKLALGLGADEVLRSRRFDRSDLDGTLERARLRASARALRDRRAVGAADGDAGFSLLGSALGEQLVEPLYAAAADCQQVTAAIRVLLDIGDDLVGWAALSAPTEELRRLAARRLAAPSTAEVRDALVRMQTALTDARFTADKLRELVAGSGDDGCVRADRLVVEFGNLIAPHIAPAATLEVDLTGECALPVSTSFFLSVAAILVSNALGALRAAGKKDGRIVLRTLEADGVPVLVVEDDAGQMAPDIASAAATRASRAAGGLGLLRERLVACGGDLVVQSDESGTQISVVFALVEAASPAAREADEVSARGIASARGLN